MISHATQPILSIRGLSKRYGSFEALSGIDLDVTRGEFVALLGPSGCGKSTTLMAVAGFVEPDAGSIVLSGNDITALAPDKRRMGMVFQDYALFPHMSVLDNVAFPLRMRKVPRREREEKALAALETVQLPKKSIHARPSELSGGQRQRVAVARALVFDPVMLLMDEPLAALDRRLRQHLQYELRHLQARIDTTVIYVTHDQEEALVLADRIVVMRNGRFEQVGRPRDIYDSPANAFVAGFLGESNSAPAHVVRRESAGVRAIINGSGDPIEVPGNFAPDQGLFVVRPERLRVQAPDQRSSTSLPAQIIDVAFLGDRLRAELRLADDLAWTASIPIRDALGAEQLLARGNDVRISWLAGDGQLLPTDTAL
ncbi:ABC transporter ATP-binding protein [Rhizobium etli]|uniref:ABC transporter ATP-binding protein n=1 Tax=Rhizobium etli TaxID=29449 RepID=UPI0003839FD7|nr:ABC transporter ATP-binding protein [Rhizobium etli]AGS24526.1 spermidine/putrescine ABC transporter ATP-binding protein PotA 4 [Rhizobium etli bv. mimosae str. Mim1]